MSGDDSFPCPHCGADVPAGRNSCRECGASHGSGWDENGGAWDADWPAGSSVDDEFDYEEFVRREFPERWQPSRRDVLKRSAIGIVVLLLCLAMLALAIGL